MDLFLLNISFLRKKLTDRIEKCRQIITLMTGNADFPTPTPKLEDITPVIEQLEMAAEKALSGDKYYIVLRNELAIVLNNMMKQLAVYVNLTADGSKSKILSTGFPLRRTPEPRHVGQVLDVRAAFTGKQGEIDIRFRKDRAANSYLVFVSQTPEDNSSWVQVAVSTRTHVAITGLQPAKYYYIKVVAIGSSGQGQPSDVAVMIAA